MAALLTKQLVKGGRKKTDPISSSRIGSWRCFSFWPKGFTNKEISEQIYLSVKTIEAHRSKIYQKLGLKTRADLVDYALRHKLLNV